MLRKFYVGREKYLFSILEIAPATAKTWKNSASFESIASTMQAQIDVHGRTDVVFVISSEKLTDVTMTYI